ncbi:MAG: phosphatase PAP2 family protein [Rhodanobacteraceae bacterium]|nr:MAG: phosphatase PAP2 family protein [Rhodanobacteraceae bacterium]
MAAGGPFGIDHRVTVDNRGIWARHNQLVLEYATAATVVIAPLVLGDESKLGDTFWRTLDSVAVSQAITQAAKLTFQRERPSQTANPDLFFRGVHDSSFPSGEVTLIAGAVTPFVVAYGRDHPAVYALELLPLYDSMARVKVRGHWQSDVLAGWAIGTATGIWAAHRRSPLILGWLPGGFEIGFAHKF